MKVVNKDESECLEIPGPAHDERLVSGLAGVLSMNGVINMSNAS